MMRSPICSLPLPFLSCPLSPLHAHPHAALYHAKCWTPRGHGHGTLGKPRTPWGLSGPGACMPPMWNLGHAEDVAKALNIPTTTDAIQYRRPASASTSASAASVASSAVAAGAAVASVSGIFSLVEASDGRGHRGTSLSNLGNPYSGAVRANVWSSSSRPRSAAASPPMRASRSLASLSAGREATATTPLPGATQAVRLVQPSDLWRQQRQLNLRPGRSKQGAALAAARPHYTSDPRVSDPRRLAMSRDRLRRAADIYSYPLRDRMWSPECKSNKQQHIEWRGSGF